MDLKFLRLLFLSFALCSQEITEIFKKVFYEYDFDGASSIEPTDEQDIAIKYFINRKHNNLELEPVSNLLTRNSQEGDKGILDLLSITSDLFSIPMDEKLEKLQRVIVKIKEWLFINPGMFDKYPSFTNIAQAPKSKDYLRNLNLAIKSGGPFLEEFFNLIKNGEVDENEAIPYLLNIKNGESYRILGDIYFYGLGVPVNLNKAMDFYWKGKKFNDEGCYMGIGKLLETSGINDLEGAIEAYSKAASISYNPEALTRLYLATGERNYLISACNDDYPPALALFYASEPLTSFYSHKLYQKMLSIIGYHPYFVNLLQIAKNAFLEKNYTTAFLLYSYLSEFNLLSTKKVVMHIYENFKNKIFLKNHIKEKIYFETCSQIINVDLKYYKDLGDCYFYGIGTEVSYVHAYGFYYIVRNIFLGATYNLILMHEHGLGITQNLEKALSCVSDLSKNYCLMKIVQLRILTKMYFPVISFIVKIVFHIIYVHALSYFTRYSDIKAFLIYLKEKLRRLK